MVGYKLIFIREDIPAKLLLMDKSNESLCIDINLRRAKWLISHSYNPLRNRITTSHLQSLSKNLELCSSNLKI